MFETRHAQTRYQLRLHRARSVILTPQELVEIRAAQRTFEGAYVRTSLGQFSFALVVLKIFTSEFYSIGASLACVTVEAVPRLTPAFRGPLRCLWRRSPRSQRLQTHARQPTILQ